MSRLTVNDLDKVAYSPWELCGIDTYCLRDCKDCPINAIYLKLAHYEDLEEQGRLIELPCKVGTDTYCILARYNFKRRESEYYIEVFPFKADMLNELGEKFFLTKAEAERKLAEMESANE